MDKKIASDVLAKFSPEIMDILLSVLNHKIERQKTILSKADPVDHIRRAQGAIAVLEELKNIRETSKNIVES